MNKFMFALILRLISGASNLKKDYFRLFIKRLCYYLITNTNQKINMTMTLLFHDKSQSYFLVAQM